MKYVRKTSEPKHFTEWKAQANKDWRPRYGNMPGDIKDPLKQALLNEQGWICCYCERHIENMDDAHVEHFIPQSLCSGAALAYENMLCSCQNRLKKGVPLHCGPLKDEDLPEGLVSPQDPTCERRFRYTGNGQILQTSEADTGAKNTIKCLGLNIQLLQALRREAVAPFLDPSLTPDELQGFVNGYLAKGSDGRYEAFWTTIAYLFPSEGTALS
jgi:uncharacterized protein (TIGR02646 family)